MFDLTCDVTGDLGVKFSNFISKILSMPLHCHVKFSARSIGYRDRWGAATALPTPEEGSSQTRPSRAQINKL